LRGKSKNIDDYGPPRLDLNCLSCAYIDNTSNDKELNVASGVYIIKHDLFERFEKVFLEVERHKLFTFQKLVRKLPETVYRKDRDHQVWM